MLGGFLMYTIPMARADLEEWADDLLVERFKMHKRKTFGCPSYYPTKKMFAFIYEDALGVKCDPKLVLLKIKENPNVYAHFNPGDGIIMKNWLMITYPEADEYNAEIPLMEEQLQNL